MHLVLRLLPAGVLVTGILIADERVSVPPMYLARHWPPEPARVLSRRQIAGPAAIGVAPTRLEVEIDVSRVKDTMPFVVPWAKNAAEICRTWYSVICGELDSPGFKPREKIGLVFLREHFAPASYEDGTIFVNADHVAADASDYGMIVHELVHAVQSYPPWPPLRRDEEPRWLTEGIADYIRFYRYEVDPTHGGIVPGSSKYTDSYRTTACFLDFLVRKFDPKVVNRLNGLLRQGGITTDEIKSAVSGETGSHEGVRDIDSLFDAFIDDWQAEHRESKRTNKTPEPTPTSVTPPAARESRQP